MAMRPHTKHLKILVRPKDKSDLRDDHSTIDCESDKRKSVGETKRLVRTRMKEHRDEEEKVSENMSSTRGNRRASKQDRWKSAILDHVVQKNHVMNWDSSRFM